MTTNLSDIDDLLQIDEAASEPWSVIPDVQLQNQVRYDLVLLVHCVNHSHCPFQPRLQNMVDIPYLQEALFQFQHSNLLDRPYLQS